MGNVVSAQDKSQDKHWGAWPDKHADNPSKKNKQSKESTPNKAKQGAKNARRFPELSALVELTKPITWFPPVWAYFCGLVASGLSFNEIIEARGISALLGLILAGPAVCGASQIINDWFDRNVDAINEPHRPIPSGRVPGRWGLYWALTWFSASMLLGVVIGGFAIPAAIFGLACAWVYSAPPFRFKRSGWYGPATVAICYEGLPWLTATAIVIAGVPSYEIWSIALLYSIGAHGIMTLNDFKAVKGDQLMGIKSLPATLGVQKACYWATGIMLVAQLGVIGVLVSLEMFWAPVLITTSILIQLPLMRRLFKDPARLTPWYSLWGISLYVLGMMVSAMALGGYIR